MNKQNLIIILLGLALVMLGVLIFLQTRPMKPQPVYFTDETKNSETKNLEREIQEKIRDIENKRI